MCLLEIQCRGVIHRETHVGIPNLVKYIKVGFGLTRDLEDFEASLYDIC